jgi:hypothetical protein
MLADSSLYENPSQPERAEKDSLPERQRLQSLPEYQKALRSMWCASIYKMKKNCIRTPMLMLERQPN